MSVFLMLPTCKTASIDILLLYEELSNNEQCKIRKLHFKVCGSRVAHGVEDSRPNVCSVRCFWTWILSEVASSVDAQLGDDCLFSFFYPSIFSSAPSPYSLFLQRTDFSWKEGRSQMLLSEGTVTVLCLYMSRAIEPQYRTLHGHCVPDEQKTWQGFMSFQILRYFAWLVKDVLRQNCGRKWWALWPSHLLYC